MGEGLRAVLDIGKTLSKLTLWTPDGTLVERRTRPNRRQYLDGRVVLDTLGIQEWLAETLSIFAKLGFVEAIIPVAHGAAAAIIKDGALVCSPSDYESPIGAVVKEAYEAQRDEFTHTGSPALPDGLNLGAQLHLLEQIHPGMLAAPAQIVTWPQYWAWVLSGVAAAESSSLGCHTDLWNPTARAPSPMARRRGWAERLAPIRRADEVLGTLHQQWSARTGLPATVRVYCGLHDSNAALLAGRGFHEIGRGDTTIVSTGTWFVAMRSTGPGVIVDPASLPTGRDVLVNVDVFGRPVPSARFMGGREIHLLTGIDSRRIDIKPDQAAILDRAPKVVQAGAMVFPTFAPGCGPYPDAKGDWRNKPSDPICQRAAVSLYAALMTDASLDLIGSRSRILVEGRFAEAELFVRALAALRPDARLYTSNEHNDVSYGALRLIDPALKPPGDLKPVAPLDTDLSGYRATWRAHAQQLVETA